MSLHRDRLAYAAYLAMLLLFLAVSHAPAPLYRSYAARFGFAPITTTVIFAVYACGALIAVLFAGPLSDRYGRKPILMSALATTLLGLLVFITAQSVGALIVARLLHGVGIGSGVVAGTAALLDLRPSQGEAIGLRAAIGFNLGTALGLLGTAAVVVAGFHPFQASYLALTLLVMVVLTAVAILPETHRDSRADQFRATRPRVPVTMRRHFLFAALGVISSWSVLDIMLSLYPGLISDAIGSSSILFGSSVVAGGSAAAGLSQVIARRGTARNTTVMGNLGTAALLLASIPAVQTGDARMIVAATVLLGFFNGFAFGGSLRYLAQSVPPSHRGEVMSAYYVVAYLSMAIPALAAGWAATRWSPSEMLPTFMASVAVISATAAAVGLLTTGRSSAVGSAPNDHIHAPAHLPVDRARSPEAAAHLRPCEFDTP